MASIAGWWAIPAVALLLIVLWTTWRGRTRKPAAMYDTVARYEQFQAVLTRVVDVDLEAHPPTAPQGSVRTAAPQVTRPPRNPNATEPRAAGRGDVP
ncbi:hypothetical protein [Yinghuangia soli]|uniref:Uncharacterized protein n=1 Tax=Yinghuangia soli TaxID=2908204 RepID=A0AA41Q3S4_9ACTN|nr:hypothetical protein [Yinghuangia soli]MCF2529899.1 hypothetical protein [Yinghuangia soli]